MRIHRSGKALTVAACATTLLVVAGCGSNGSNSGDAANQVNHGSTPAAMTGLVGSGCAAYAKQVPKGPGSVAGMAADPVAVAASNNPLLTTLVKAVSGKLNPKVNLVNTLDNGQYTVFAPVDSAFAKLPATTVAALSKPANAAMLTSILTYHVVPGQLSPATIDGTHKTAEGQNLTVSGSGDSMTVNGASVICGGVKTANATVYLIGSVLMPPSSSVSSDLVGPGCAAYAKQEPTGPASVAGMAADPVAVAASNNPLLTTLVKAVSGKLNPKVNLVNTLDNGQYTVFAPIDSAFAKLPASTIAMLSRPQNASKLAAILGYHVVAGQLSPAMIVGTHKTLEGSTLKVTGSGMSLKVNGVPVVCGGVKTANATVYLIGSVLSPSSHSSHGTRPQAPAARPLGA